MIKTKVTILLVSLSVVLAGCVPSGEQPLQEQNDPDCDQASVEMVLQKKKKKSSSSKPAKKKWKSDDDC